MYSAKTSSHQHLRGGERCHQLSPAGFSDTIDVSSWAILHLLESHWAGVANLWRHDALATWYGEQVTCEAEQVFHVY